MTPYERWRADASDLALDAASLAVYDTETTGLDFYGPGQDRVVALCVLHGTLADEELAVGFHEFIHPGRPIPEAATRIHGISTEEMDIALEAGVAAPFAERRERVLKAFEARIQVAHNLDHDALALRNEFELPRPTRNWVPRGICTVAVSWAAWPHLKSHSLAALCDHIGIPLDNAHEAKADSVACFQVLRAAVADLRKLGPLETVGDLITAQEQGAANRRRVRQLEGGH